MRRATLQRVGGACVLVLAAGALSGTRALASADALGERGAIQRLLDRRAAAFLERNERAYLSTVSRTRPGFFRAERRRFRWAAAVPFASYELRARWDELGNLVRPSDRVRYRDADDVAILDVEERYRVRGFDPRPAVEDAFLTFVRERGRWRIAFDSDLAAVGVQSARQPWDLGPVRLRSSEHFALLSHPCSSSVGCARLPSGLLVLAERALERVQSAWRAPWHDRVLLVAPTSTAELARILQATFDLDNFVAFATSTVETRDDVAYTGHRVLLKSSSLAGRSADALETILAHELMHVATRPASGPFVPTFVEEGIAEYVAHRGDPGAIAFLDSVVASGAFDGRLPRDDEFLTGSSTEVYTSYQEAQSALRYFVDRWGFGRLAALYRRLGRPSIAAGTSAYHLDRALRATIGMGAAAFQRAWADSIRG